MSSIIGEKVSLNPIPEMPEPNTNVSVSYSSKKKPRITKLIAFEIALFVLVASSIVSLVDKVSPVIELVDAYHNTILTRANDVSYTFQIHASVNGIMAMAKNGSAEMSLQKAKDIANEVSKISLVTQGKGKNSAIGLKYDGLDILGVSILDRVFYLHSDAYKIASQSQAPWTAEDINSLLDAFSISYLDPQTDITPIKSFLNGEAFSYSFKPGTPAGKIYDDSVTKAKTAKANLPVGILPLLEKALKDNGSIKKINTTSIGDEIDLILNVPGFMKSMKPVFIDPEGLGYKFAKDTGINSNNWDQEIQSLPKTLTLNTWIKNGKISQVHLDLSSILFSLYYNQKAQAYLSITQADVTSVGQEITALVSDYTSFGTNSGIISLDKNNSIIFSKMTNASGAGLANPNGPGNTNDNIRFSSGTSLVDGTYAPDASWCIVMRNQNAFAKYTNAGLVDGKIGTPLSCDPKNLPKLSVESNLVTSTIKSSLYLSLIIGKSQDLAVPLKSKSLNPLLDPLLEPKQKSNNDGNTVQIVSVSFLR